MRELRFRAYNTIVRRFQEFSLQDIEKQKEPIQWHILKIDQYTGLRDKKGKKIFENDIVEYSCTRCYENTETTKTFKSQVKYIDDCFLISETQENDTPLSCFNNQCVIIGNIHEYPIFN